MLSSFMALEDASGRGKRSHEFIASQCPPAYGGTTWSEVAPSAKAMAQPKEGFLMNKLLAGAAALATVLTIGSGTPANAQTKQITLCWAAWDPANALVE